MKTLFVSLAALAAVSGAALAQGGNDVRNSETNFGKPTSYATDSNALTIVKKSKKNTAFERMNEISEENERGGKDSSGAGQGNHSPA